MPRYLVTGANGQLGQCFQAVEQEFPNQQIVFSNRNLVDITFPETLQKIYNIHPFDGIINCSAYTNVDKSEEESNTAYEINAKGVANLSNFTKEKKIFLVHFSTDYIFDGTSSVPYKEDHKPNPINKYGLSKYEGERILRKAEGRATTFRISWLFSPYGNNFVKTILKLSKTKEKIQVVNDQRARPTYGVDLARSVMKCLEHPHFFDYDCYHYAQQGSTTWFELALKIVSFKKKSCHVNPCSTFHYPSQARRPLYSVLDTTRIEKHLSLYPSNWELALENCLNRIELL